ncbi:MAG: alpha/beta hydrolase [Alphaproteobacteria bacterium]|nr:alpha/beta hydrolase [Alphaproteobacteria bacterium]
MSMRSEVVRLGLRWLVKRRNCRELSIEDHRQFVANAERLVPDPPASTQTLRVGVGAVKADLITTPGSAARRYVLFLHGGGFIVGSPRLYRHLTWRFAETTRARVLAVDYRLAPEHPFPAALEDAISAYHWLITNGADPRQIAIIGDSAGGGLVFSLMLLLRDEGVPLPGAAVALSPWTDLALTGSSLRINAVADPMLNAEDPPQFVADYLAGADPRTPYVSPLYGDPAGLPPTIIQVGSDEVLRDDAVRMADRLRAAGCEVELEIWPRMPHVWHVFAPLVPEARRAIERVGSFVRSKTGYEARTAGTSGGEDLSCTFGRGQPALRVPSKTKLNS